eukprot:7772064-Ditylum_brightwellii.AAC.1
MTVTFGQAMSKHLIRIYNLRISYLDDDTLLWDDDATGAFRQCKLHPDLKYFASSLSSCSLYPVVRPLAVTHVLPTGNPLGEPGRPWHNAFPDSIHKGVMQADGVPVNTPHN